MNRRFAFILALAIAAPALVVAANHPLSMDSVFAQSGPVPLCSPDAKNCPVGGPEQPSPTLKPAKLHRRAR